jgi:hypothetical protein
MGVNPKAKWRRVFWRKVKCPRCFANIGNPCHMGRLTAGEAHTVRINLAIKMGLMPNRIHGLTTPACFKRKKFVAKPPVIGHACEMGNHKTCYLAQCACDCHPKP